MELFNKMYNEFEKTKNLVNFEKKYSDERKSTRFFLIRSLDTKDLKSIIQLNEITTYETKQRDLMKVVFESDISISKILEYIENRRKELIEEREAELDGLAELLADFPVVGAGIRDDKVDGIIKQFVRNKSFKKYVDFENYLNNNVLPRVSN